MSTLSERIEARKPHPPINGCTVAGVHDCILRRGGRIPTVLELAQRRALAAKDTTGQAY